MTAGPSTNAVRGQRHECPVCRAGSEKFSQQTPYAVGIVELKEGVRLTTQIIDADLGTLEVGQRVKLVFRKVQEDGKAGILCYGYKAITI